METESQGSTSGQTLTDHLAELRDRIVKSLYAIIVFSVGAWFFRGEIFDFLIAPVSSQMKTGNLQFINLVDPFMVNLKIAVVTGIAFATPVWLYQSWLFIAPGLYAKERRYTVAFISSGTLLFVIGVAFAYYLVLPAAVHFFISQAPDPALSKVEVAPDITFYLSLITTMALVFGLAFELPLAITLLGVIGIVDAKFLKEKRRFAILGLAIVAAVVTPPDALSMLMLLIPLCVLYEISILLVGMLGRKSGSPE